jgi:hypothetical protein
MDNPYNVGDAVLASRAEDGENHEEAKVVDAYSLIIGPEERPMVCVEFPDGHRSYLRADGPDVLPVEEPEAETEPDGDEAGG